MNASQINCVLCGSDECRLLNSESCLNCCAAGLSEKKQRKLKSALARLMQEAPVETVTSLYTDEHCRFCKGEGKNSTECYAKLDLAKDDPDGDWTMPLSGKKRLSVKGAGMLLPIQMSCCKSCRTKFRVIEFLPTVMALLLVAVGLVVVTSDSVHEALYAVGAWAPFMAFALTVIIAVLFDSLLRYALMKVFSKTTIMHYTDDPVIAEFLSKGWVPVNGERDGRMKLVFSKQLRTTGVYSNACVHAEPIPPLFEETYRPSQDEPTSDNEQ